MARFFVGQRVRIVHTTIRHHYKGREFRVIEIGFWPANSRSLLVDAEVMLDDGGLVANWQIEPILPEGHAPGTLSFHELMDKRREGVCA